MFWFSHNLDFRGRTYAIPPHFNHLGGDTSRAIIQFAKGKPLGPNGLNWIKIHLVNLTGLKKRSSNTERLQYADEKMADILDSADKPLNVSSSKLISEMSQCMRFPTMWHFDMCRLRCGLCGLLLSLETPNGVQSVA